MAKKITLYLLMSLLIMWSYLAAEDTNVTGKWEMTRETPRGQRTTDIEFVQEGDKLTVTWEDRMGEKLPAQGYVKDNEIGWEVVRQTPRGRFTMTYKGTVAGDTMKGEVIMGRRGSMEWSASKKK